jgi:citrate lyase subunit beta/citryl-CoA lyase
MVTLVVPGSSERMLAKARDLDVDELVIDLEDAVVPERKAEALRAVLAALNDPTPFTAPRVLVRVNAIGSEYAHTELIALAGPEALDGIVVPKVESAGDLAFVDRLLDGAERAAGRELPLLVHALIETAQGIGELNAIAAESDRLEALILGYADLSASLGRSRAGIADLDRWLAIQDTVLVVARSAGLLAIDGPYLNIDDADGLAASAQRAADLGYDGKWAIHPSQLEPVQARFMPGQEEIAHAEAVLARLAEAAQAGGGATTLNGEMLDEPVRLAAVRTLARAGRSAGAPEVTP